MVAVPDAILTVVFFFLIGASLTDFLVLTFGFTLDFVFTFGAGAREGFCANS